MLNVLYKEIHVTTGSIALRKVSSYRTYSHNSGTVEIIGIESISNGISKYLKGRDIGTCINPTAVRETTEYENLLCCLPRHYKYKTTCSFRIK